MMETEGEWSEIRAFINLFVAVVVIPAMGDVLFQ